MFVHSAKKNKARRMSGPSPRGASRRPSAVYALKPTRSLSPSYPSPCHSLTSSRSSIAQEGRSLSASGVADLSSRWLIPGKSGSSSGASEAGLTPVHSHRWLSPGKSSSYSGPSDPGGGLAPVQSSRSLCRQTVSEEWPDSSVPHDPGCVKVGLHFMSFYLTIW